MVLFLMHLAEHLFKVLLYYLYCQVAVYLNMVAVDFLLDIVHQVAYHLADLVDYLNIVLAVHLNKELAVHLNMVKDLQLPTVQA